MPVGQVPGDRALPRDGATATLAIASGANQSGVLTLHGRALMMMHVPSGIAGSLFTFQAAGPDGAFNTVYDDGGNEVQVVYAASRAIGVDLTGALAAAREVRVRSGPTGSLNAQTDQMIIGIDMKA